MKRPVSCENCQNSFCRSLSSASREKIFKASRWVTYQYRNEQMIFFGDGYLMIIEDGDLMTIRTSHNGKQQGIDVLNQGDVLGIVQLFNEGYANTITVRPLSSVSGCMLPLETMQNLITENHDISLAIIAQLSKRFARVIGHFALNAMGSSKERLDYALSVTKSLGVKQLTHEELAVLAGLNRVTVTKNIKDTGKPLKLGVENYYKE